MGNRKSKLPTDEAALGKSMTEQDLLAELSAAFEDNERRPGEVTTNEVMEATGKSREAVRAMLNDKVQRGVLVKRTAPNGHVFYSKANII